MEYLYQVFLVPTESEKAQVQASREGLIVVSIEEIEDARYQPGRSDTVHGFSRSFFPLLSDALFDAEMRSEGRI
jgi:hypothetical protein